MAPNPLRQRLSLLLLCLPLLSPSPLDAQEVPKAVLEHIRSVSVSIECAGRCKGSGTLFDKEGETWCLTAQHVVEACQGEQIRICQHRQDRKPISVNAEIMAQDEASDTAWLRVGRGVFGPGAKFHRGKTELDVPLVHCGSMAGLHHTIARGYLTGRDRRFPDFRPHLLFDQADFTGYYGSSGGGVFLTDGRYVGMVSAGIVQRIVFFVPVRRMKGVLE